MVGYGRVGRRVAQTLWREGVKAVVIDADEYRIETIREDGHDAILGNATRKDVLVQAGIDEARFILVTVPNGLEAGAVVEKARKHAPTAKILVRTHYEEEIDFLLERGADRAIWGEKEMANLMVDEVGKPVDKK